MTLLFEDVFPRTMDQDEEGETTEEDPLAEDEDEDEEENMESDDEDGDNAEALM